jgi:hypothetical protein
MLLPLQVRRRLYNDNFQYQARYVQLCHQESSSSIINNNKQQQICKPSYQSSDNTIDIDDINRQLLELQMAQDNAKEDKSQKGFYILSYSNLFILELLQHQQNNRDSVYDYGLDEDDDDEIEQFCTKLLASPVHSEERHNTSDCAWCLLYYVFIRTFSDTFSPLSPNTECLSTPIAFPPPVDVVDLNEQYQRQTIYSPQPTKDEIPIYNNHHQSSSSHIAVPPPPQQQQQYTSIQLRVLATSQVVPNEQQRPPPPPRKLPPPRIARPPQQLQQQQQHIYNTTTTTTNVYVFILQLTLTIFFSYLPPNKRAFMFDDIYE